MEKSQILVLQRAIDTYGIDNQLEMVIEECAELIQAIQKLKRAKFSIYAGKIPVNKTINEILVYANLCSEVADVKIMLAQLEIILNKTTIDISVDRKIDRLEQRLNKSENPI